MPTQRAIKASGKARSQLRDVVNKRRASRTAKEERLIRVRVVLFEEEGWKVAQCLEYDIAAQAKTLEDLYYQVERMLVAQVIAAEEFGRQPFQNFPPAPSKYVKMWERAFLGVQPAAERRPKRKYPVPVPEFEMRAAA